MLRVCEYKNCKKEFEAKRSNQKYCCSDCRKFSNMKDDPITGGYIKRKGNQVIVKGAMNVAFFGLAMGWHKNKEE
jgi:hypothetical protein